MTSKQTARIVGAFFLIAMVTSIAGGLWIQSILDAPDYPANLSTSKSQVTLAVLLELINGISILGIAVFMYPVLRGRHPALAMGYVGNRIVEAVTQVVGSIVPLALLTLDQRFLQTGALDLPAFQALGGSLIAVRDQTLAVLGIFFCLGALLFYEMLYQSRLIPRWISAWGFVAALLIGVSTLLGFFDISAGMLLALPIILNEILLGIWLIVRGFEPSAAASEPAD